MALQDFKHMKRDTPHKTHAHLPREVASGVNVFIFLIRKSAAVRRTTAPQRSSGRREEGRAWALAGLSTAAGCSQQGGGGVWVSWSRSRGTYGQESQAGAGPPVARPE